MFVDRYGAVAITDFFKIELNDIKEKSEKECITIIEVYNPEEAECLLKSIPIKDLTKDLPKDTLYYKAESDRVVEKYNVNKLPALLVFKSGKLKGHIEGYYTIDDKEVILSKLNDILRNN